MKIWQMKEPYESNFACFDLEGTWKNIDSRTGLCPECTAPPRKIRVKPIVISWEPGSDVIGDFIWSMGGSFPLVQEHVFAKLKQRFSGFEAGPVKMVQAPELKRPVRRSKRVKPRVRLPYKGPPLCELWITVSFRADLNASTIRRVEKCSTCGYQRWEVDGIETIKSRWNKDRMALDKIHTLRAPGQGLFVRKADLGEADIFEVREIDDCILCTDRAKEFVEHHNFSNVSFLEAGNVI